MPKGTVCIEKESGEYDKIIVSLYQKMYSARTISKIIGISRPIIVFILKRNNVQLRKNFSISVDNCKTCIKCKIHKSVNAFSRIKEKRYNSVCKSCIRIANLINPQDRSIWIKNNPDKVRAIYKRKYDKLKSDINFVLKERVRTYISSVIKSNFKRTTSTFDLLGYSVDDLKNHLQSKFTDGMSFANYGLWHIDHIKPVSSFNIKGELDIKEIWSLSNLQPLWAKDNLKKGSFYKNKKHYYGTGN